MDRSNLKDQEKPPTAPPRPHHSITTGPTQLPPSPNTRQPAQPSAVTASPTIRPSPQATPKDTSHLGVYDTVTVSGPRRVVGSCQVVVAG